MPLFCRHFVDSPRRIALRVGLLYACNTLGAAVGCAVTGLWLMRMLGVDPSIWLGAVLNMAIAAAIWLYPDAALPVAAADGEVLGDRRERSGGTLKRSDARRRGLVFALFFLAGFAALGNEILWTRFLSLLVRNTVYTYTVSLAIVLTGIVLGSALVAGLIDRLRRRALLFASLQVVGGLLVLAELLAPAALWMAAVDPTSIWASLPVFVAVLLPPAVLSGAAFPLATRMVVVDPALAGAGVGALTAVNTLGGILGSLSAGFVLLPYVGLHATLLIITGCSLLVGFVALGILETALPRLLRGALIFGSAALWLLIPRALNTRLPQDFLAPPGALVDFREGLGCQMAVVRKDDVLQLEIDRLWQGQNVKNHQVMAAHIPMLLHPAARDVAVVGLGVGQTCSRFLMHNVDRVDCVEIEGRLIDLVREHFDSAWMNDSRLRFIVEDGRNYLTHTRTQYDVISLEIGQVFRPGLASFYTLDFYQSARGRLKPDGLLCQFVPLAAFTPAEFRTVVRTFIEAFPQSTLWYNTSESLIIGRRSNNWQVSPEHLALSRTASAVRADMHFAHWGGRAYTLDRPAVFLASFLAGPTGLARIGASARVYRDDRPYLEYSTSHYLERAEVPVVDVIREGLEPLSALLSPLPSQETVDAATAVRELNLRDVVAAAFGRTASEQPPNAHGRRIELLRTAVDWNPQSVRMNGAYGDALMLGNRIYDAVTSYRVAVELDPENARSRSHLGRALFFLNQYAEAAEHLRLAIKLNPADAGAHNNLGASLAAMRDYDNAIPHFEEAVRLDPNLAEARKNLETYRALRERAGQRSGRTGVSPR